MRTRRTRLIIAVTVLLTLTSPSAAFAAEDPETGAPTTPAPETAGPTSPIDPIPPTPSAPPVSAAPTAAPAPAPVPQESVGPPVASPSNPATATSEPPAPIMVEVPQATSPDQAPTDGPRGVDISRWQHPNDAPIDWDALHTAPGGVDYVFLKGSEGVSADFRYRDGDAVDARAHGTAVGFYHYAVPNRPVTEDARAEAQVAFAAAGGRPGAGTLPQVLDLESNPNDLSREEMALWAKTWLEEVRSLSGRTPILYTYGYFFSDQVSPDPDLGHYPLWIAHYGLAVTEPTVPAPWATWTFWQYSAKGSLPGVASEIDLNVFAGTAQELDLLAGRLPTEPRAVVTGSISTLGQALSSAVTPGKK